MNFVQEQLIIYGDIEIYNIEILNEEKINS